MAHYKHKEDCPYTQDDARCSCGLRPLGYAIEHLNESSKLMDTVGRNEREFDLMSNAQQIHESALWLVSYKARNYEKEEAKQDMLTVSYEGSIMEISKNVFGHHGYNVKDIMAFNASAHQTREHTGWDVELVFRNGAKLDIRMDPGEYTLFSSNVKGGEDTESVI